MKLMLLVPVLVLHVTVFSAELKSNDVVRSVVSIRRYVTNDAEMIKLHGTNALYVEGTAWFYRSSSNLVTVVHNLKSMILTSNSWTELEIYRGASEGQSQTLQRIKVRLVFSKRVASDGLAVLELQHPFPNAHPLTINEKSPPRDEPVQSAGYVVGRKLHLGKGTLTYFQWGHGFVPELFGLEIKSWNNNVSAIDVGCSGAPIIDSRGHVIAVLMAVATVTIGDGNDKVRTTFVGDTPCEGISVGALSKW